MTTRSAWEMGRDTRRHPIRLYSRRSLPERERRETRRDTNHGPRTRRTRSGSHFSNIRVEQPRTAIRVSLTRARESDAIVDCTGDCQLEERKITRECPRHLLPFRKSKCGSRDEYLPGSHG